MEQEKAKQTILDSMSSDRENQKMLSQKSQTFPLLSSFKRADCRLMLLK